jgi:hypothetical protein
MTSRIEVVLTFLITVAIIANSDAADLGELRSIEMQTGRTDKGGFVLSGRDSGQQLIVTGRYASGEVRDLSRDMKYQVTPTGVVEVSRSGWIAALAEGEATIHAAGPKGRDATIRVRVTNIGQDVPINFPNEVVPIFTKAGCNAGGCHGKSGGQNGFALSLLGFEPQEDYEHLVLEARGRRLSAAAPQHSLLLRKATGTAAHGGGSRIDVDSPSYRIFQRWIEQGMRYGAADDPVAERIEVLPTERLMPRGSAQQLVVVAHYSDGSTRDVTRIAQFESNDDEAAEVSETGLVTTHALPGNAAIMVRFQAMVGVFRATIPLGAPIDDMPGSANFIDELVFKQLEKLGLPPSSISDDATYLRRATIDIAGRLPTLEEAESFLADKDADKREQLVDLLLASSDYAIYFANKWSAILRNRREGSSDDIKPTAAFHEWIRKSLDENRPYDQFVREIITATGEEIKNPPVTWYRAVNDPAAQVEDAAQLFLGTRIQCARCHHHPFEKWSQQDYYGLQAFFSRVEYKRAAKPKDDKQKKKKKGKQPKQLVNIGHKQGKAAAINPKTRAEVAPTGLGEAPIEAAPDADPREALADWMARRDNPFFAKALVNRYWKHFFGRGLVDPEDDLRMTNPPTNPELLDALAARFVKQKFDLKKLVRAICTSTAYQLSAESNEHNKSDRQNFSRYYPRRLNAEVLLDAIDQLTESKSKFSGVPDGTRAVQLPDNAFNSYFLTVFGRPNSSSACECERSSETSLAQLLHLLNSKEILDKTAGNRAKALAKDKRPHEERIRELYMIALSRAPSGDELTLLTTHVENNQASAYADVIWALVNAEEFLFNH